MNGTRQGRSVSSASGLRASAYDSPLHIFASGSYGWAESTERSPAVMREGSWSSRDPLFALTTRHTHSRKRLSGCERDQTCLGRATRWRQTSTRTSENNPSDDYPLKATAQVEPGLDGCRSPCRPRCTPRWPRWPGAAPLQPTVGVGGGAGGRALAEVGIYAGATVSERGSWFDVGAQVVLQYLLGHR